MKKKTVRTTIHLEKSLLDELTVLAKEKSLSRNVVLAQAVQHFIQERNQKLLEAINAAYADGPDNAEEERMFWTQAWREWKAKQKRGKSQLH